MANRLMKEFKEYQRSQDSDIILQPESDGLYRWNAFLKGPPESPFSKGIFHIVLEVPSTYPLSPPTGKFITKIFHPNVHFKTGEICLDILKTAWTPAWTLQSVCRAITTLLSHPEADSPLNCDAGNLLRAGDEKGFKSMALMYTAENAMKSLQQLQKDIQ